MPYLLIFFSLIFVSCRQHKTNALSEAGFRSDLAQSAFLTIDNKEAISFLRGKILNTFVEAKIPSELPNTQMKNRDELKHYIMNDSSLAAYSKNEKSAAKLIVSYSDRTEIYFLPENIPLESLATELNLKPESNKFFKWVTTNTTKTFNGVIIYLVSLNLEDIVKNDQNYFNEVIDLKNEFVGKKIIFIPGKSFEFNIDYSTYRQAEVAQDIAGRRISCTPDNRESGACGACYFKRDVPADHYIKMESLPLSELGFSLRLGDRVYSIYEFNPVIQNSSFKITVNTSDYDLANDEDGELMASDLAGVGKYSPNYGHTGFCPDTSGGVQIGLKRKVEASVRLTVRGRGIEALKDIL